MQAGMTRALPAVFALAALIALGWVLAQHATAPPPPAPRIRFVPVPVPASVAPAQQVAAAPAVSACPAASVLAVAAPPDGAFDVADALASPSPPPPRAYLDAAKDALAQRRWHDAEAALIASCRLAARKSHAASVPLARAQGLLGQLYAQAAREHAAGEGEDALRERARALLQASADGYAAVLGPLSSRTRLAQRRLAQVETASAPEALLQSPGEDSAEELAAPAPVGAEPAPPAPEVAQLDSDLTRLAAQARSVTADPAGFERRAQQAQRERDACGGNAQCLRRWFAQRRRQLFGEF